MIVTTKARSAYERELLAELRSRVKGSGWKLSRTALFKEKDGIYRQIIVSVHFGARLTSATLGLKPMSLDPLLWDILVIPENHEQSLSFRTWGAFTCQPLPIKERQVEAEHATAADVAAAIIAFCQEADGLAEEALQRAPFSSLLASHPNHLARGAYAISLVLSLIAEGKPCKAREEASAYASGIKSSVLSMTSVDKSFHELAIEWLNARERCACGKCPL
ncbi:MAG TPA: hypothetical protein VFT37_12300 [Telluria sp.]|nr:hypothetical protein [Telluria sp.]